MIWNDFHFFSRTLEIQTAAYVLLPDAEQIERQGGKPIPTLYLLHGLSDDHTMWMRKSRIEQYARAYYVAVVMPACNRSFYADMVHGAKYWTFVSEELPRVMEACFPLCRERAGRFAAGLSMGGYGAMKLGLARPERYAAVAALSAPLMMHEVFRDLPAHAAKMREWEDIFGDEETLRESEGNLAGLAETLDPENAPKLYAACGTQDFLFPANEAFVARFGEKLGIRYRTEEGADHTWDFWDARIHDVLSWLPLEKLEGVW